MIEDYINELKRQINEVNNEIKEKQKILDNLMIEYDNLVEKINE